MTNTAQPHSHPRTSSDRIDRFHPPCHPPKLARFYATFRLAALDESLSSIRDCRPRRYDRGLNMEGGHPRCCWGADGGIDVNVRNLILDRNSRRMPSGGKPVRFQQCDNIEERKMRDVPERVTCMTRPFNLGERYSDNDDTNSFDSPYRSHGEHSIARMWG